jgi:hypothetical protein
VDGDQLLRDISEVLTRFVVLPKHAEIVLALWVLHAHALDAFSISPVLEIRSPTPECGKTVTLSILRRVVPRPLGTANISPSALFRVADKIVPTLLIDEGDTFVKLSDELRGILNCSHVKSEAFIVRTEGDKKREPRTYSTWCAKAVALIGDLPPTLRSRAITVQMERKRDDEKIEQFRLHLPYIELENLRRQAWRWAQDNLVSIRDCNPILAFSNRLADNWEPLARIAEIAGGSWPEHCRNAAVAFYKSKPDEESARILLLEDLRAMFHKSKGMPLSTDDILTSLNAMEDRSWGEWKNGKCMSAIQLARLLKHFKIRPKTIRQGSETPKGYAFEDCEQSFSRYLPKFQPDPQHITQINENRHLDSEQAATQAATPATSPSEPPQNVSGQKKVAGRVAGRTPGKLLKNKKCGGVAGQNGRTTDADGFDWVKGEQEGWEKIL